MKIEREEEEGDRDGQREKDIEVERDRVCASVRHQSDRGKWRKETLSKDYEEKKDK